MDKQIEELMKEIHLNCPCGLFEDEAKSIAKFVIEEQGYRKQNEVASEIISDIEQAIMAHGTKYALKRLEEIKKKYMGE